MDDPRVAFGRRLEAIAAQGLAFATDVYDRQRYADLAQLAEEYFARHRDRAPLPIDLDEEGYLTPKVDVRSGAFDDRGRMLLVREVSTGRWSAPGGWAEVNLSPSEAARTEVREEAGWDVEVTKLVGLLDRRRRHHPAHRYHVYKALFLCRLVAPVPTDDPETDAVGFFDLGDLPPLDTGRTTREQVDLLARHHRDPTLPPSFD